MEEEGWFLCILTTSYSPATFQSILPQHFPTDMPPAQPSGTPKLSAGPSTAKPPTFTATIIGAYDLPPPSTSYSSHLTSPNGSASLPIISCTLGGVTTSTGTPKSKHPTNLSYRYDCRLDFRGLELKDVFGEKAVFKIVQGGVELCSVGVDVSSLGCVLNSSSSPITKGNDHIFTLKPSKPSNPPPTTPTKTNPNESPKSSSTPISSSCKTLPSLRVNLCVTAPYRPEIVALTTATTSYLSLIDQVCAVTSPVVDTVTSTLNTRYALIPIIPIVVGGACLTPIIAGVCIIGLPLFLPLFVIMSFFLVAISAAAGVLYISTPSGRRKVLNLTQRPVERLLATPTGKQLIFQTGDRPSPVTLADQLLPKDMYGKLLASVALDFLGSCSYLIPGAGEAFDLFWAPFQTICVASMYDAGLPGLKYLSFAEEIIPFTDFIPTASLGWIREFGPTLLSVGGESVKNELAKYKSKSKRN